MEGVTYYYVDDVLVMSSKAMETMDGIRATFKLKGDKAEKPDMYLGASLEEVETTSGTKCWSM